MQYPVKEPKVVKLKDPAPIKSAPQVKKVRKIQKKMHLDQLLIQRNIWNKNGDLQ